MLASAALVLLMTPGLAFFYGGMVRSKSVLNMLMMSFIAIGRRQRAVGALRLHLAFGDDVGGAGLLGNLEYVGLETPWPARRVRAALAPAPACLAGPDAIPVLAFACSS